MSRVTIAIEGKVTVDGRLLLPGSLTWRSEPFGVLSMPSDDGGRPYKVLGWATNLREEEDGRITAEIDFPLPEDRFLRCYIGSVNVDTESNGVMVIGTGVIRQIFVTDTDIWEKDFSGNVST